MLNISFNIEGEEQLARRIRVLDKNIKDLKPEFQQSADFLKNFFGGEVFDTKGKAIDESWKPRKQPTGSWPLLEKTGNMRRSFRAEAKPLSGSVFNVVSYFKYHQSRMPRRHLPRRIMMFLTNQLKNQIIQIFHKGIYQRIKKSK